MAIALSIPISDDEMAIVYHSGVGGCIAAMGTFPGWHDLEFWPADGKERGTRTNAEVSCVSHYRDAHYKQGWLADLDDVSTPASQSVIAVCLSFFQSSKL